jgi:hypothetical protein
MKGFRIAVIVAVGTLLVAPRVYAQSTDAEFKCEKSVNKAGAKFVGSKSKCVQKCLANAWKGVNPFTDCDPPSYGGTTAACIITDPLKPGKSAEEKFAAAIAKACDDSADPTHLKLDCPECYTGGDCTIATGEAGARVQNIEGQVDGFVPGVGCEQAGATPEEQKCQTATAKALTKQVATLNKCYDKCIANARKGLIPASSCNPPASDVPTSECVGKGDTKTILAIDKVCVGAAIPDCPNPDDYGGQNGASWTNAVDSAITGNIPSTYCEGDL